MLGIGLVVLGVAAIATAGVGCGESTHSGTLSRTELIAKANTICGRVNDVRNPIRISKPRDYLLLVPFAAYEQRAYAELAKIAPPASLAGDWKELVLDAQTIASDTVEVGRYAQTNNLRLGSALLAAINAVQKRMNAVATRNEMKECANVD